MMHCPKCGLTYTEGSQRFCDTDGARLVSPSDKSYQRGRTGVFSTILPVTVTETARQDELRLESKFVKPDRRENQIDREMTELFFETDEDDGIILGDDDIFDRLVEEPTDERIFGRKINPYEIPAGHVEVDEDGEREHPSLRNQDFDANDPQDFVGRIVKGRYRVTELVGEEDTGFAFLAEDGLIPDKRVTVRILSHEELDEVTESIFAEERVSLSHISHPNVVRLIDSGQFVDGTTFLISEYIDALTALEILQIHGSLDATRIARIIRQAGNALSEVHREGILHRDLRPDYLVLVLTDNGTEIVKLSGFGITDGEPNSDNLHYKAPEIFDGRIPTVASDIYSLGVIAYQLLTDRLPFPGNTEREIARSMRAGLEVMPSDVRSDISHDVDDVIGKVLSPEPLERFSTAREFGDALFAALTTAPVANVENKRGERLPEVIADVVDLKTKEGAIVPDSEVIVYKASRKVAADKEAAWTRRSPEPPSEPHTNWLNIVIVGFIALAAIAAGVWYYVLNQPSELAFRVPTDREAANPGNSPVARPTTPEQIARDMEVPPPPRTISQPANSDYFQSNRESLKGDLLRNFVGFSLYYPKDWKVTRSLESPDLKSRGKFLDIARNTPDGKLKEQMLVSYYASNGTFKEDAAKFPQLVKETNDTLKKLLPNYQLVSEGNTTVNGGWNAYEVKFQGSGEGPNGERLIVWGRRLFVPAARPGVRSGFEITMLATSYADEVRSVDDVGTKGELAQILYTFEPSQNF